MPETKFQKKYVVRLSADERDRLQTLVADLKIPSADVLKARILLHADVSAAGDGWTDGQIAKALSTTRSTVARTRLGHVLARQLEAPPSEIDKKNYWDRWDFIIGRIAKYIFFTLGLGAGLFICYDLFDAVVGRSVEIAPIAVPKHLLENGYTPNTAAIRLLDAIKSYVDEAEIIAATPSFDRLGATISGGTGGAINLNPRWDLSNDRPDFVIPTLGISLEAVAAQIRRFIRSERHVIITGEITEIEGSENGVDSKGISHKKLKLHLRKNGEIISETMSENPEGLYTEASTNVLRHIAPRSVAVNKLHTEPERAIEITDLIINNSFSSAADIAGAKYLQGLIYLQRRDYHVSNMKFEDVISNPPAAIGEDLRALALNILSIPRILPGGEEELRRAFILHLGVKGDPDPSDLVDLGNAFLRQHNNVLAACSFELAIDKLNSVITLNPRSAAAYVNLGYAYKQRKSVKDNCSFPEVPLLDGIAGLLVQQPSIFSLIELGMQHNSDSKQPSSLYRQALQYKPYSGMLHYILGRELFEMAEDENDTATTKTLMDDAEKELKEAVSLNPKNVNALEFLSYALYSNGQQVEASSVFRQAIAERTKAMDGDPVNPVAYRKLGILHYANGEFSEADNNLSKAIDIDSEYVSAYFNRGLSQFSHGNYRNAVNDFQKSLSVDNDGYVMLWYYLARVRSDKAAQIEARKELRNASGRIRESREWPSPIIELLIGDKTPLAAWSEAKNSSDRCEASFYIGEWLILQTQTEGARYLLQGAADDCRFDYVERSAAIAELSRL